HGRTSTHPLPLHDALPICAGLGGDTHRVVDGAVSPVPLLSPLRRRVLRVVDQEVDAVAQLEHGVCDAPVGWLLMVADVGDRDVVPVDPVADRGPRMGHGTNLYLRRADGEVGV